MEDRHKAGKSKYTADRQMPGAFEGETVTRRRFMTGVTHGAGGVAAAAFALPALGFALGPIFSRVPVQLAADRHRRPTSPTAPTRSRMITIVQGIGEAGKSIAYVRTRNPAIDTEPEDQYNHFVALSSRCMHLGCPVRFVAAAARFICPCHGGVYDFRGMVAGGPPVRPAGSLLHAPELLHRTGRDRPALLGQLRARALLPARSRPAAGRHRAISVSRPVRHLRAPRQVELIYDAQAPRPTPPQAPAAPPKRPGQNGNGNGR